MSEINHGERAHSEIGASSASRWLACPASVSLSRGMDNSSSSFAEEGTAAHELCEACLNEGLEAKEFIGQEFNGFVVDEEMASHVQYYLNNLAEYLNGDYDTFVEEKFELGEIHEDMFGSNDFCAMGTENGELVIADFKYGKGLNVKAEGNVQLVIYALGAYYQSDFIYNFKTVKMIVCQPRYEGEEWDEWIISVDELLEWEEKLKAGVKEVYSDKPKIESGSHCRFCKAKHKCPELKAKTEDTINSKFEEMPVTAKAQKLPEPTDLSKEQIIKVLTHSSLIEDWMKSVRSYATSLMEKGEEIEGFKLVRSKTNRKIKDEKELIAQFEGTFGGDLFRSSLKTMDQLEKLIGKKEIEPFLFKPEGSPVIAPLTDKRPAIEIKTIDESFDDSTEEEDFDNMEF